MGESNHRLSRCSLCLYGPGKVDTAHIPKATLADFYRFALLLTGDATAAETALAVAFSESDGQLAQIRNGARRQACLAMRIRECCAREIAQIPAPSEGAVLPSQAEGGEPNQPSAASVEVSAMARHFHALPEPERSALALFHLDLFTCKEITEMLRMELPVFAATLSRGRSLLEAEIHSSHHDTAA